MFNFDELKKIKKTTSILDEERESSYKKLIEQVKSSLVFFRKDHLNSKEELLKTADLLTKALKIKKNIAEPYVYISYIFFVTGNDRKALNYLRIAEKINNQDPQVIKMKEIFQNFFR